IAAAMASITGWRGTAARGGWTSASSGAIATPTSNVGATAVPVATAAITMATSAGPGQAAATRSALMLYAEDLQDDARVERRARGGSHQRRRAARHTSRTTTVT